jgi:hypothetical protein
MEAFRNIEKSVDVEKDLPTLSGKTTINTKVRAFSRYRSEIK